MRLVAVLVLSCLPVVATLAACSGAASPAASSDASSRTDDGLTISCDAGAVCTAGHLLGTVSGDTADAGLTASGTTAAWVHVRVTEDDGAWAGHPVRLHATLTSPSATSFELHAYLDTSKSNDAGLDCRTEVGEATVTGTGSTLDIAWGDPADASANGFDDGRTVALEIRLRAGECNADAPWQLEVRGGP